MHYLQATDLSRFLLGDARQEDRQETDQRQVGADVIDEVDAVGVGDPAGGTRRSTATSPQERQGGNRRGAGRAARNLQQRQSARRSGSSLRWTPAQRGGRSAQGAVDDRGAGPR